MSNKTSAATVITTKAKKPSVSISTTAMSKNGPSASPSSANKRLPASAKPSSVPESNISNATRSVRKMPRVTTRNSMVDIPRIDQAPTSTPQPFVLTNEYILKTYRDYPPSLIVHLYPNFFRFDQQDGSFSYQSEMRVFLEHLKAGTIPHDMLEEFRADNVRFYQGWLIVRVHDHRSGAAEAAQTHGATEDDKPASMNNYNHFITPSPYAPYPNKDQAIKMERTLSTDKENQAPDVNQTADMQRAKRPKPRILWRALRPTEMSKQTDLLLDFTAIDPKSKKAAKVPATPIGTVPPAPSFERPPPAKKLKFKIDPKDHLEYEARITNAMAPPLYLEPAEDLHQVEEIHKLLRDPACMEEPASPKSRKRTHAEVAADDAHAKQQERFLLIMDSKGASGSGGNAINLDGQANVFQPRFERFNVLHKIRHEQSEKKRLENEKRHQDEEVRRAQQQQLMEEENRRKAQQAAIDHKKEQAIMRSQAKTHQMHQMSRQQVENMAQHPQNAQPIPRRINPNQQQMNGIPPNMQNQMMAAQASSPVIRQGTPNMASSPAAQTAHKMGRSGSQTGAASPARPGSSLQHTHPNATNMIRQASGQGGPSRNGTPQIPHSTPGMANATPILRQGTPSQHMPQQSPMVSMATPQMAQANVPVPMVNGMHNMNPQMQALRKQQMQQMVMQGGQVNPAAMQHMQQQAMLRQQQANAAQAHGTPQSQHMSPNSGQGQNTYNAQLRNMMQQQMRQQQGSPAPQNQMSPQQIQQMQFQAQQQAAMMGGQQVQNNPTQPRQVTQSQLVINQFAISMFKQLMVNESQKYNGNPNMIPAHIKTALQTQAQKQAVAQFHHRQNQMRNQQQQQMAAQGGMVNGNMGNSQMNPQMNAQMNAQMQMNRNMAMMQQQNAQQAQLQQQQQMQIQNAQAQMQQNYLAQVRMNAQGQQGQQ